MQLSTVALQLERQSPPDSQTVRLEIVTDPARLEALRPDWSALLARSASNEPMLSPTWLLHWWRVYGPNRQLKVALFYQEGRLIGLAPLQRRRYWYKPGVPFQRLEPLGADVDEDDGVCSDYLNVIAEAGLEGPVSASLARALVAGGLGRWTEFIVPAMDATNPMLTCLCQALEQAGLTVSCPATGVAPYIRLPETWETYLQALHQRKRYVIVRALRDFDKWAGNDWQLHEVRTAAELAEGRNILLSLHDERWQTRDSAGAFGGQRFRAFHDAVMPRLLEEDRLELLWLSVRGEPIAALYNIVANNKVYFYQCGRKMDLPKGQRPGIVLLAKAIQRAIAAGRREFDFLAGASQYKGQLAPLERPLAQIRAVPRRCLREVARIWLQAGCRRARSLRRNFRIPLGGHSTKQQATDNGSKPSDTE
jgi:CelD/BcsL family acetyltransferase involved in cellulose biosynthesis